MNSKMAFENIVIAPGVRETVSEDGAVLLDIKQGICFSLNSVGLTIWRMLKAQYPLERMVELLEREFCRPRAELIADICDFTAQLEARRLIRYGTSDAVSEGWVKRLFPRSKRVFHS